MTRNLQLIIYSTFNLFECLFASSAKLKIFYSEVKTNRIHHDTTMKLINALKQINYTTVPSSSILQNDGRL